MKTRFFLAFAMALALVACNRSEKPCPILDIEGGQVQGVAADL